MFLFSFRKAAEAYAPIFFLQIFSTTVLHFHFLMSIFTTQYQILSDSTPVKCQWHFPLLKTIKSHKYIWTCFLQVLNPTPPSFFFTLFPSPHTWSPIPQIPTIHNGALQVQVLYSLFINPLYWKRSQSKAAVIRLLLLESDVLLSVVF